MLHLCKQLNTYLLILKRKKRKKIPFDTVNSHQETVVEEVIQLALITNSLYIPDETRKFKSIRNKMNGVDLEGGWRSQRQKR